MNASGVTNIHFEVPRPLTRTEMRQLEVQIAKITGSVKKVKYPTEAARIEKNA